MRVIISNLSKIWNHKIIQLSCEHKKLKLIHRNYKEIITYKKSKIIFNYMIIKIWIYRNINHLFKKISLDNKYRKWEKTEES